MIECSISVKYDAGKKDISLYFIQYFNNSFLEMDKVPAEFGISKKQFEKMLSIVHASYSENNKLCLNFTDLVDVDKLLRMLVEPTYMLNMLKGID
jgi:hypothetical protein